MSKQISTNFTVNAPAPIDSRMQVPTYAHLALIPIKYIGLKTYVVETDKEYRYKSGGWVEIQTGTSGGDAVWGSITGSLPDQTDLNTALGLKYNKTGGTISGLVTVLANVEATNFVTYGGGDTSELTYLTSTVVGEPVGATVITNIVKISQADYDAADLAGELVSTTYYLIT